MKFNKWFLFLIPVIAILAYLSIPSAKPVDETGADVAKIRSDKDENFRNSDESPIKDKAAFKGLNYYPFNKEYIVDFVLPKYNLVLEIDGPHHRERRDYDKHRTRVLEKKGFKVLRLYSSYCYSEQGRDKLLQLVEKTCQALSSVCNQPLESEPAG